MMGAARTGGVSCPRGILTFEPHIARSLGQLTLRRELMIRSG